MRACIFKCLEIKVLYTPLSEICLLAGTVRLNFFVFANKSWSKHSASWLLNTLQSNCYIGAIKTIQILMNGRARQSDRKRCADHQSERMTQRAICAFVIFFWKHKIASYYFVCLLCTFLYNFFMIFLFSFCVRFILIVLFYIVGSWYAIVSTFVLPC